MPYTYRLAPAECMIRCNLTGPYDIRETQQLFRDLCAGGRCPEGWGVLVDVTTREGAPTSEGIASLMMTLEALSSRLTGRIGFVTGAPAQFGMARMLEIRAEMAGLALRAFMNEPDALAWIREVGPPAFSARGEPPFPSDPGAPGRGDRAELAEGTGDQSSGRSPFPRTSAPADGSSSR